MRVLGIDTSNYTTSAAVYDGQDGWNAGRLLDVRPGELGLRQSEALFQHVKRLPKMIACLREQGLLEGISAVGASTAPRAVEGSYMPCFLAGESCARILANTLGVPFIAVSHQQGHVAAAAWSAGHMELLDRPHLAWHLSGGTTELLLVEPEGKNVTCSKLGGTSDISAGQLIDRTGQLLGLDFPAGKALDALCQKNERPVKGFSVKTNSYQFSLSGIENKAKELYRKKETPETIAGYVLDTIANVVAKTTQQALEQYPGLPVLCSGGVASNSYLRRVMRERCGAVFAKPEYSTDNALGVAVLAWRGLEGSMV